MAPSQRSSHLVSYMRTSSPKHGRQNSRQSRDFSNSRSRSRSNSRSRNNSSSSSRLNNSNNDTNTSHPNASRNSNRTNHNHSNPRNNGNSSGSTLSSHKPHPIISTPPTSPPDNPAFTLPQHIIDKLKAQIKEIATTLKSLDETVSWMQDTITHHDYRIFELESMMNSDYNNSGDSDLYPPHDDQETHSYDNGWFGCYFEKHWDEKY
ncbi:hypothetical protein RirG_080260 [Rhizophagus irregularis DAOM 197198w]|uniref:Uncharacterized protein n=1 Tax=Rhizophagus irregularis (strain DAOM 197198w) TaxID=1432141 RepID=A0A015LFC4_RHIIW|nr:hypothetical protein RirG_080260 [Rhizophagus irregularis DAOM 197198w]